KTRPGAHEVASTVLLQCWRVVLAPIRPGLSHAAVGPCRIENSIPATSNSHFPYHNGHTRSSPWHCLPRIETNSPLVARPGLVPASFPPKTRTPPVTAQLRSAAPAGPPRHPGSSNHSP